MGYSFWKVPVFAPSDVGTDAAELDVNNARTATVPDVLVEPFKAIFGAAALGPNNVTSSTAYRFFVIKNMIGAGLAPEGIAVSEVPKLTDCRDSRTQSKVGYRSRSLEGVGFTGPFLHNGSVPTVDDLLKPAAERPKTFRTGCRTLDTERLGFACTEADGSFLFDTSLPSNHNGGHEFGTDLAPADRAALLEYMKSLEEPTPPPLPAAPACTP
jgi:hypothetical protein